MSNPTPFPSTWDESRYSVLILAAGEDEAAVQAGIIAGLAQVGVTVWPVEAGGKRARGGVQRLLRGAGHAELARAAAAVGRSETPKGHADLAGNLAPSGRGIYLEVKRPAQVIRGKVLRRAGAPDADQLAFLVARHLEGCLVGVVWSLGDALRLVLPALSQSKTPLKHIS